MFHWVFRLLSVVVSRISAALLSFYTDRAGSIHVPTVLEPCEMSYFWAIMTETPTSGYPKSAPAAFVVWFYSFCHSRNCHLLLLPPDDCFRHEFPLVFLESAPLFGQKVRRSIIAKRCTYNHTYYNLHYYIHK